MPVSGVFGTAHKAASLDESKACVQEELRAATCVRTLAGPSPEPAEGMLACILLAILALHYFILLLAFFALQLLAFGA